MALSGCCGSAVLAEVCVSRIFSWDSIWLLAKQIVLLDICCVGCSVNLSFCFKRGITGIVTHECVRALHYNVITIPAIVLLFDCTAAHEHALVWRG